MKKPVCKLTGENGNIFNLVSIASNTLKAAGLREEADELKKLVSNAESYDEALNLIRKYVDVQ